MGYDLSKTWHKSGSVIPGSFKEIFMSTNALGKMIVFISLAIATLPNTARAEKYDDIRDPALKSAFAGLTTAGRNARSSYDTARRALGNFARSRISRSIDENHDILLAYGYLREFLRECQQQGVVFEAQELITELLFLSVGLQLHSLTCAARLAGVAPTVVLENRNRE